MKLDTIATILEDAKIGVIGKSIFKNFMPAEIPAGILLRDGFSGTKIDHELPGFYKASFQLIVRNSDHATGLDLIERAIVALTIADQTVDDMVIRYMRPRTLPFGYPLSPGNLTEFVTQIDVAFNIV